MKKMIYFTLTILIAAAFGIDSVAAEKTPTAAKSKTTESSTKALAEKEMQNSVGNKIYSPEQTNYISLNDPYANEQAAESSWVTFLTLENYTPNGEAKIENISAIDLSKAGSIVMPALEINALSQKKSIGDNTWKYGLGFSFSSITQDIDVKTQTGMMIEANLHSTRISLLPIAKFNWSRFPKLWTRATVEYGRLWMAQTSQSSLARWTGSSAYTAYGLGLEYDISKRWSALANYSEKKGQSADSGVYATSTQIQIGAGIKW